MLQIIDGYNLLHVSGIFGSGGRHGALAASRTALLDFLVARLPPRELAQTAVVFDAKEAPPNLPREFSHAGLHVIFAPPGGDADAVIEGPIEAHRHPQKLTIVSSDHRLHRAARRRKVAAINSDAWYMDLLARSTTVGEGHTESREHGTQARERDHRLSAAEVARWVKEFGPMPKPAIPERARSTPPAEEKPGKTKSTEGETKKRKQPPRKRKDGRRLDASDLANPFPPGYGSDVTAED